LILVRQAFSDRSILAMDVQPDMLALCKLTGIDLGFLERAKHTGGSLGTCLAHGPTTSSAGDHVPIRSFSMPLSDFADHLVDNFCQENTRGECRSTRKSDVDQANARIRQSIQRFLAHVGAPLDKYHETLTRAWILAVAHFINQTPPRASADELIERNPQLLDSRVMLTHYSVELLFSDRARGAFVEPDLERIPSASRAN